MGVSNGGGGGGSSISAGTAAGRPAAGASAQKLYWATDTDEITYSDGSAWHVIRQSSVSGWFSLPSGSLSCGTAGAGQIGFNQGSGFEFNATAAVQPILAAAIIGNQNNTNAASEAATATAGSSGAAPAQVAGYFVCVNRGSQTVKIPYYGV